LKEVSTVAEGTVKWFSERKRGMALLSRRMVRIYLFITPLSTWKVSKLLMKVTG